MKFATALIAAAAAENAIEVTMMDYAKSPRIVQNLVKSVVDVKGAGDVTFAPCAADSTDFTMDPDSTTYAPKPLTKGTKVSFHLGGVFGNSHTVENVHVDVKFNGSPLAAYDYADGKAYDSDYAFDMSWDVPGFAPSGAYSIELQGQEAGKKAFCIAAQFSFWVKWK